MQSSFKGKKDGGILMSISYQSICSKPVLVALYNRINYIMNLLVFKNELKLVQLLPVVCRY